MLNSLVFPAFFRIFAPAIPREVHCIGENNLYKSIKMMKPCRPRG